MKEEWKPIKGYEGLYEVSNTGKIKSFYFGKTRILSPRKNPLGYLHLVLYKDKVKKDLRVHRLVASAFIPNPNNKPEVNHIDGDKENNNVDNLEWATRKENINHSIKTGLCDERIKKRSCPVIAFDMDGNFVGKFSSQTMAAKCLGINNKYISEALCEKSGVVCGYRFERINRPV